MNTSILLSCKPLLLQNNSRPKSPANAYLESAQFGTNIFISGGIEYPLSQNNGFHGLGVALVLSLWDPVSVYWIPQTLVCISTTIHGNLIYLSPNGTLFVYTCTSITMSVQLTKHSNNILNFYQEAGIRDLLP